MSTAAPAPAPTQTHPRAAGGYEVSRPAGLCSACGNAINPDDKLMAGLRETPLGFERIDCCIACWPDRSREDLLAYWQTIMPRPEAKRKVFVDDTVLCELFERLAGVEEPAKRNFRFVLGLILMRKRLVIYESSRRENDTEHWTVRLKGREDLLDVINPRLDEAMVLEVSQQLSEILNQEM